jgi:tRNA dimethylallyltransferase
MESSNYLVLTGPTASGKTELGVELAERLNAEIISMDSMAVYRGMDIGTAKPSPELRNRVKHDLIDVLDPWESSSVAWWLDQAERCRREIEARGKRVLFVGGTPLYLKALLRGLFPGPAGSPEFRQRLIEESQSRGSQVLQERLAQADPESAQRIHANDIRRIIRALEVLEFTGRPISAWQQEWLDSKDFSNRCLWLDVPRDELYARINSRVREMATHGWVEEVHALLRLSQPMSKEARQALGYKEIIAHVQGQADFEQTVQNIQTRSRHFAKRQITWFRHLPECRPVSKDLTFKLWDLTMD